MKLKKKFNNAIVQKNGMTFNSNTTPEKHYKHFYDNGFEYLFDVEEEVIKLEDKPKKSKKITTKKKKNSND